MLLLIMSMLSFNLNKNFGTGLWHNRNNSILYSCSKSAFLLFVRLFFSKYANFRISLEFQNFISQNAQNIALSPKVMVVCVRNIGKPPENWKN